MGLTIKRGDLPRTPHTAFYAKEGVLALEEIHGSYGFGGRWSRKMHVRSYPTEQVRAPERADFALITEVPAEADILQPYMIETAEMPTGGDALRARTAIVRGPHTTCSIVKPAASFVDGEFFRNGDRHEVYFIHEGEGVLESEFGTLPFVSEDYVVVPKGTTYRLTLKSATAYMLLIESQWPIEWPRHYLNHGGQAHTMSPIFETEVGVPALPEAIDARGEFAIFTKHDGGRVTKLTLGHHPFDVVGWEGALYPFTFNAKNFHDVSREIHAEPPQRETFQAGNVPYCGFSLCTFGPHMEGWHAKDVPAPYAHQNVDSDEIMFFCNADYGARKGMIANGSFTIHPGSLPHSPHGKAALQSLESRGTVSDYLAIMLDTYFETFEITTAGYAYRRPDYATSWNEAHWA